MNLCNLLMLRNVEIAAQSKCADCWCDFVLFIYSNERILTRSRCRIIFDRIYDRNDFVLGAGVHPILNFSLIATKKNSTEIWQSSRSLWFQFDFVQSFFSVQIHVYNITSHKFSFVDRIENRIRKLWSTGSWNIPPKIDFHFICTHTQSHTSRIARCRTRVATGIDYTKWWNHWRILFIVSTKFWRRNGTGHMRIRFRMYRLLMKEYKLVKLH